MTATVEIITNKMRDALVVPIQAVTVRSDTSSNAVSYERVLSEDVDESFEVVFTPDGMKAGLLVVESGIQDDEFIIVTGVEDSTEVVTGPYSAVSRNLKRGTRITTDKK
jgi:HlyD family secretion protein